MVYLAPPPEEGIGDRRDLGWSPPSGGESLEGAEDQGPTNLRRDRAGASWCDWLRGGGTRLDSWGPKAQNASRTEGGGWASDAWAWGFKGLGALKPGLRY